MLKLSHPIISINGFKIGDKVRLKDGDGRPHIIKSFSIDGMKEFFFEVQFEDGTEAMLDNIAPLSSNLDEAAEEYAWKKEEPLAEWERLSACFNCFNPRIEAFKAGAEWMNKQMKMPNSTKLISEWHNVKTILEEKDFRGDEWRLAYNAFMFGFSRGINTQKTEK